MVEIRTSTFSAFIADNEPCGIHRRGYNGVASLIPAQTGNNLFVPTFSGMNYETIELTGLPPFKREGASRFEPRSDPMSIERADAGSATLVQPETSHAGVSARIVFRVEEPHYLHQRIELTFNRQFCPEGTPCEFNSLWASYIHMPTDRRIYLKPDMNSGTELSGWIGITKEDHSSPEMIVKALPSDREISAEEHLSNMESESPENPAQRLPLDAPPWPLSASLGRIPYPARFYYGLVHDGLMMLMMFRQPERFRIAYSPCGAGKEPAWNPAWDYILHLDDAQTGVVYAWELCLCVKPFAGRGDALNEYNHYTGG
ncbi:MAG TPA: hypothetical protein PL033_02905 [Candidatus Brocadiia bacterium]|nr:hypothetical protein [Candidatus Brocadiia bacterium]